MAPPHGTPSPTSRPHASDGPHVILSSAGLVKAPRRRRRRSSSPCAQVFNSKPLAVVSSKKEEEEWSPSYRLRRSSPWPLPSRSRADGVVGAMEADETRRGKEALSGGHLCHVCGYQYPNPHPSAKLRRSHRRNCRRVPAAGEDGGGLGVDEREEAAGERNAAEGLLLGGGGGGEGEGGNGASEANGGSALRGSAKEDGDSVGDKENAERASPNGAGVQVITSGCVGTGLINCTNNSCETANEGKGTNIPRACTNGSQHKVAKHCSEIAPLAVAHPAEREDILDDYQDASPFLHQSDLEDGAAVARESDNLNNVSLGTSVAANEISVEINGLCKDHSSREPGMTDLPAGPKVGNEAECYSENKTHGLSGPEDSLKLESPDEYSVNIDSNNTDVVEVDGKSDKTSGYCEFTGDLNPSSLQKCSPLISDPESQSTCSRKVEGLMEDNMDVLHTMSEVSPRPGIVGSDNNGSETVSNSGTNFAPIENELKLIHTKNTSMVCSTECSSHDWSVEDTSDVQLPVENSCLLNSVCSVIGYQNGPAVCNVDGMLKSIAEDNCSDGILVKGCELDFSYEERPQQDVEQIVTIAEENPSLEKHNVFSKQEVCNRENDPVVSTKYQVSTSHEHVTLLMDQASCIKNPFNLDDTRSDDLFELDTDSYHLEAPNVVESKQQVDSTYLTVSSQTSIAEGQHCLISVGAEDMSVSRSAHRAKNISSHDASVSDSMQEGEARTSGIICVPSQVFSTELSMVPISQEINAHTYVEEKIRTEGTSTKDMAAEESIYKVEENKQTEDTSAKEMNAILKADYAEEEKLTEDTSTEMNAVQQTDDAEEKKQAEDTGAKEARAVRSMENVEDKNQAEDTGAKGVRAVQSMENVHEKNQTEDTSAKMYTEFNADNAEEKKLADGISEEEMNAVQHTDSVEAKKQAQETRVKEMNAVQSTGNVEEKKQTERTVGREGNKQNEEIAAIGSRLNSGRIHVPLKVLLAEASLENKEKKPSTKERVLSFRRRVSKDGASSVKPGSPKAGSDDQYWNSPAKLPHNNADKRSKGRKQPWVPFICCNSVH